jgi:hypothetical protein
MEASLISVRGRTKAIVSRGHCKA